MVFYDNPAELRHFSGSISGRVIAESVCPNHGAGVDATVGSHLGVGVEHHVWKEHAAGADGAPAHYHYTRGKGGCFMNKGGWVDHGMCIHSADLFHVEHILKNLDEGELWVVGGDATAA
jgi:hypothetical protein